MAWVEVTNVGEVSEVPLSPRKLRDCYIAPWPPGPSRSARLRAPRCAPSSDLRYPGDGGDDMDFAAKK